MKMWRKIKHKSTLSVGGFTIAILLSFQLVNGSETKGSNLNDVVETTTMEEEGAEAILNISSTKAGGVGTKARAIKVDNDVQNIFQGRVTQAVFLPKNVDKADFMPNVTDTPAKESEESVKQGGNVSRSASNGSTTSPLISESKSELSQDPSDDGVGLVSPSTVTKTATNPKTETEPSTRGEEESSTLLVLQLAQCRANCVVKKNEKLKKHQRYSIYSKKMDVYASKLKEQIRMSYEECWDTCLLLEIENGDNQEDSKVVDVVCSLNNNTCLSGCQDACEFHHYVQHVAKNGTKPPLLAATKVESFLSYNLSTPSSSSGKKRRRFQLSLQWPESEDPSVVYSIVQHVRLKNIRMGWTWRLLEQTTMTKISLTFSEKPKIGDIRVLAATSQNLVHVFSQEKVEMKLNVPGSRTTPAERPELVRIPNEQQPPDPWHLRKVSMVHQKFLVVTEITWDLPENKSLVGSSPPSSSSSSISPNMTRPHTLSPKYTAVSKSGSSLPEENNNNKSKHRHNFLLTWEVSGGILKGNMVTDANTVTISLWPDTIYSIQVGLIEEQMNVEAQRLNPWEYEVEPKVTIKSSLLSVNTSDAVYLTPEVERTESDVRSDLNSVERVSSSRVSVKSSISSSSSSSSSSSTSSDVESISSLAAQIPLTAAEVAHTSVEGVNDNDHIRNSTTLTSLRCELASGASKWLCQLSISWLVILCSIYGLLFIFSMTVYLFFAFKHYPYCSHRRLFCCCCFYSKPSNADYYLNSRSTCKLALLPHDFQQQRQHDFPHVQHCSEAEPPQQKKDLDILSQYNIV